MDAKTKELSKIGSVVYVMNQTGLDCFKITAKKRTVRMKKKKGVIIGKTAVF